MGEYITLFENSTEYNEYRNSSDFVAPNVSYLTNGNDVRYEDIPTTKLTIEFETNGTDPYESLADAMDSIDGGATCFNPKETYVFAMEDVFTIDGVEKRLSDLHTNGAIVGGNEIIDECQD